MKIENLTEDELKDIILKKQLEWIKLCQDNFLIFAESVWQDFIYRKTKDPNCLLYTSPSPRDRTRSRMPSSA